MHLSSEKSELEKGRKQEKGEVNWPLLANACKCLADVVEAMVVQAGATPVAGKTNTVNLRLHRNPWDKQVLRMTRSRSSPDDTTYHNRLQTYSNFYQHDYNRPSKVAKLEQGAP